MCTVECLGEKIIPKNTKWFECHLNHIRQYKNESVCSFNTAVRQLASNCTFKDTSILN